jgi:hypothetical protein
VELGATQGDCGFLPLIVQSDFVWASIVGSVEVSWALDLPTLSTTTTTTPHHLAHRWAGTRPGGGGAQRWPQSLALILQGTWRCGYCGASTSGDLNRGNMPICRQWLCMAYLTARQAFKRHGLRPRPSRRPCANYLQLPLAVCLHSYSYSHSNCLGKAEQPTRELKVYVVPRPCRLCVRPTPT